MNPASVPLPRLGGRFAAHALPGTTLLAWRNLVHDRARFVVTLVGIVFAVLLMGVQLGLLVGFSTTASTLIDNVDADLWVTAVGTTNVDIAAAISERRRLEALAVPGVASADNFDVDFGFWKKPTGGNESVILVGMNPANGRGAPWNLVEGSVADLMVADGLILDRLYKDKLGVHTLGETVEINGRRARVVGFTDGIRTFTQSPYVFTTGKRVHEFNTVNAGKTKYVLIKLAPGADLHAVQAALRERLDDVLVWTRPEFARQTQTYWMITTGAGGALLLAALLGLVVGTVIVGQTLYASTVDRLPEYATLRAMGAANRYLYTVILKQAAISAMLGYAVGLSCVLLQSLAMARSNIALVVPFWLVILLAVLTGLMCALGAIISIRRVTRIDPTVVFA